MDMNNVGYIAGIILTIAVLVIFASVIVTSLAVVPYKCIRNLLLVMSMKAKKEAEETKSEVSKDAVKNTVIAPPVLVSNSVASVPAANGIAINVDSSSSKEQVIENKDASTQAPKKSLATLRSIFVSGLRSKLIEKNAPVKGPMAIRRHDAHSRQKANEYRSLSIRNAILNEEIEAKFKKSRFAPNKELKKLDLVQWAGPKASVSVPSKVQSKIDQSLSALVDNLAGEIMSGGY